MSVDALGDQLSRFGETTAAIDDRGASITYAELIRRADALCAEIGTERRLILLEGGQTVAWLVAYVAGLRGRHVMLIAPADAPDTLNHLAAQFQPDLLLRAASAYRPEPQSGGHGALHPDLAVMLSTSGSTGSTKCVRLSQTNIAANAASIAEYLGLGSDERGTVNLPTHYSYGLSIVNSHLHAGATMLLTGRSVIDREFWEFLSAHQATSFAGVPHVYDLLRRIDLAASAPPSLRYFTQAGGRMPAETAAQFLELAGRHGWRVFIMYGQTEATARIAYLPPDRAAAHPDCIGIAIPGGRLTLIDDTGAPIIAPDIDGEMIYEGPNVMMGYATSRADLAGEAGPSRLPTGDIARLTDEGLFKITGRLSRFVKIFGNRIGLDDVERLLAGENLTAITTGIDDQLLVVTRDAAAAPAISAFVTQRLKLPPAYFEVRTLPEYPLLASGKIDYASLKASLTPPMAPGGAKILSSQAPGDADAPATVAEAFASVFGASAADPDASFNSLGGDSLNYVLVAMALESVLPRLPEDWESMSIADLDALVGDGSAAALAPGSTSTADLVRKLTTLDLVRGLCVVMVVATHSFGEHVTHLAGNPHIIHLWDMVTSAARPIRMPAFFMISGYLASKSLNRPWREVAEGRFYHIAYLYLLWLGLGVLYNGGLDVMEGQTITGMMLLRIYALQIIYPFSVLWFLYSLLIFYVLARAWRDWPRAISLGIALVVFIFAELLPPPASYIARSPFFYLLGAYVPSLTDDILRKATPLRTGLALLAYLPAAGLVLFAGPKVPGIWLPATCIGLVLMLMAAATVRDWRLAQPFVSIGRETLPIFVMHPFLLSAWMLFVNGPGAPVFRSLVAHPAFLAVYPVLLVGALAALCLLLHRILLAIGCSWLFEMPNFIAAPLRRLGRRTEEPQKTTALRSTERGTENKNLV